MVACSNALLKFKNLYACFEHVNILSASVGTLGKRNAIGKL